MGLSPADLVADITRRSQSRQPDSLVLAYWFCPDGPRKEYATAVTATTRDLVPLVVSGGFQVANNLIADLSKLIAEHEPELRHREPPTPDHPLILLLLSREEFRLPQTASAARLPDWFPGLGGTEVAVWIEDLSRSAAVAWDHPSIQPSELHAEVYRLDLAVGRRLREVNAAQHAAGDPWFQLAREVYKTKPATFAEAIDRGMTTLAAVTNQAKYRMALDPRHPLTPVAAGVLLVGRSTPDSLTGIGKKFADALGMAIDPPTVHRPLTALLEETTNPTDKKNKAGLFGQTVLQAAYTAHRLYSVAAHTDEYPFYPLVLVRSVISDVAQAVRTAAQAVETRHGSSS
ncbi:hypothetical protein [Urbifossiella limnaea]|uniref:Uncharacterized protein n=1 Tax=Urbifossiella limnaea TaxID=2528023 RepID=A0A517XW64_9BACT|nr:hypothetical protein [Urbifossiella limnaea]QDU21746.1 hypothetical protein ETAA1_37190 [Urbifossiella limnaea]